MKKATLQKVIDLLFSHSEGDFVSKAEAFEAAFNLRHEMIKQNPTKIISEKSKDPLIELLEESLDTFACTDQNDRDLMKRIETALLNAKS